MTLALPLTAEDFSTATWPDLEPFYKELLRQPLAPANVRDWLAGWSALDVRVDEAHALAMVAYTADTGDAAREAAYLRWASEIAPKLHEMRVRLGRRLLPFADQLPDLRILVRELRTDSEIFREENLPRMAELEEMEAAYDKITGGLSVVWDGEIKTIPELQPYLLERDRGVRERAFRMAAAAYIDKHDELAALFDRMVRTRHALALAAGFDNYRDYTFAAKYRFDYTPADCLRFHESVEVALLPAIARLDDARRRQLQVDTVRPWDTAVQPQRDQRLVPFHTTAEFLAGAQRIFDAIDEELGTNFRVMVDERLLDLESRPGKAPGGYCVRLPFRGRPFIFMNAVGVNDDVNTLVHESGHAFHAFATSAIPYVWQRDTTHEASELASMSMELLAAPHLARPTGFYAVADAADAQLEHLEDVLRALPHIASVDAFQHWLYTEGVEATAAERDARWLAIRQRFEPSLDWSGLDRERVARWYRQSHIFTAPFYYIEYGLAQLGALQIWRQSRADRAGALARYKSALALGGTVALPGIYAAAGAALTFEPQPMEVLVSEVEARMAELRAMKERA